MSLKIKVLTSAAQRQSGFWFSWAIDNCGRILSVCVTDKQVQKIERDAFVVIKDYDVRTVDDVPHVKLLQTSKVITMFINFPIVSINKQIFLGFEAPRMPAYIESLVICI